MGQSYNEVLVCYDIQDNRTRQKLFQKLKETGLVPAQKSVFWGYVNRAEEKAVQRLLQEHCARGDKGFVVRVNLATQIAEHNSAGYQADDFPRQPPRYHVL